MPLKIAKVEFSILLLLEYDVMVAFV